MDQLISFLKEFNIQTILLIGLIIWCFKTRDSKLSSDRLRKDLILMDMRVSRLEGTVYCKYVYDNPDVKKV